jgi:hypothetical protein
MSESFQEARTRLLFTSGPMLLMRWTFLRDVLHSTILARILRR